MPTTKLGEKITWSEFFKRWKGGMQRVTQLQQMQIMFFGQWIVLAGILFGLVMTFRLKNWWIFTILIGSVVITLTQMLGTWQKMMIFSSLQKSISERRDIEIENE